MTVAAITERITRFNGSGSTGPFTFTWKVLDKDDITVTKYDSAGVAEPLTEGSGSNQYTIALITNGTGGASITLNTALAVGETLVIKGSMALSQPDSYANQSQFYGARHEASYDRSVILIQERMGLLDRAIRFPEADTVVGSELPLAAARANKMLAFDSDGSVIVTDYNYDAFDSAALVALEASATASAAAALTSENNASTHETNAAAYAAQLTGTSTTSNSIATGYKAFTTQSGKFFDAGARLLITSDGDPDARSMFGTVTSYSGTALVMNIDAIVGSGVFTDWTIRVSGERGAEGPTGPTGPTGSGSGDLLASNNLSDVSSASTAFGNIKQAATETASGVVELATSAETTTGTDTTRAVHPAGLAAALSGLGGGGLIDVQFFTSSGTWTKPTGCTKALVFLTGGGGGGGGYNAAGSAGGSSAFGSALTVPGATGGKIATKTGQDYHQTGYSPSSGVSGEDIAMQGGEGGVATCIDYVTGGKALGGTGGQSFWGGGTSGVKIADGVTSNGNADAATAYGAGGGAGGYMQHGAGVYLCSGGAAASTGIKYISSPDASYAVTIGAGGAGGGTSGNKGGNGAPGVCMVMSFK